MTAARSKSKKRAPVHRDDPVAVPAPGIELRPDVKRTEPLIEELLQWISDGKPLRAWCRLPRRPDRRTVTAWVADDPVLRARYETARAIGFDELAEDVLALVDEPIAKDENGRTDNGLVAQRRLQADVRLKLLACWNPSRYSDRLQVAGDPNAPLKVEHSLSDEERAIRVAQLLNTARIRSGKQPLPITMQPTDVELSRPPDDRPLKLRADPLAGIPREFLDAARERWEQRHPFASLDDPIEVAGLAVADNGEVAVVSRAGVVLRPERVVMGQPLLDLLRELAPRHLLVDASSSSPGGPSLYESLVREGWLAVGVDVGADVLQRHAHDRLQTGTAKFEELADALLRRLFDQQHPLLLSADLDAPALRAAAIAIADPGVHFQPISRPMPAAMRTVPAPAPSEFDLYRQETR